MPQGPSAFLQGHGVFARHNQFGTFQVKNEQNKTETSTKFQKSKTTKAEQKTTVADKVLTVGQRASNFRALAYTLIIIGVAAACGLSVCPPLWSSRPYALCACAHRCPSCHSRLSLALVCGRAASHPPARLSLRSTLWAPHWSRTCFL